MKKRLILAGGGHAHLHTLLNMRQIIAKGHEVILISPSEYQYYSGMGPGMLGGTYEPADIRFNIKKMTEEGGGSFIKDFVVKIDPVAKLLFLKSGLSVSYDAASFNTGSIVPFNTSALNASNVFTVKPVENLYFARNSLIKLCRNKRITVAIIGGGPAAAEIAGNVHYLCEKMRLVLPSIDIYCDRFMAKFSTKFSNFARMSLLKNGVKINEQCTVKSLEHSLIRFSNGSTAKADLIFIATGVAPAPVFKDSNIQTGPDGGLAVNRYLQATNHPEIFGGGDCIHFIDQPLDKAGVYAVRQAPVLFKNICAFLDEKPLEPFEPGKGYLMILNTGGKQGVLKKNGYVFEGRTAFFLKDYIDRKFMKKFQARFL